MIIAVDFDGTIVQHKYPSIGKEIPFAVETLRQLSADGHKLILWTIRNGETLEEAISWCKQRGLQFYAVNSNYPTGSLFPIAGNPHLKWKPTSISTTATSVEFRIGAKSIRSSAITVAKDAIAVITNPRGSESYFVNDRDYVPFPIPLYPQGLGFATRADGVSVRRAKRLCIADKRQFCHVVPPYVWYKFHTERYNSGTDGSFFTPA